MTERICYKFEEFFLDPGRRSLLDKRMSSGSDGQLPSQAVCREKKPDGDTFIADAKGLGLHPVRGEMSIAPEPPTTLRLRSEERKGTLKAKGLVAFRSSERSS